MEYRQPIPKGKEVQDYVMVVLCAEWKGQFDNLTRSVNVGSSPKGLPEKQKNCAQIEGEAISNMEVGGQLSEVLERMQTVYSHNGYTNQWKKHHQGEQPDIKRENFL